MGWEETTSVKQEGDSPVAKVIYSSAEDIRDSAAGIDKTTTSTTTGASVVTRKEVTDAGNKSEGSGSSSDNHSGGGAVVPWRNVSFETESEGEEEMGFDPMLADFLGDTGLAEEDPNVAHSGTAFKENRTKDVPCRFHDGYSGTCWKGSMCPYGHATYTGGKFSKEFPGLAMAAGASRHATSVLRLPSKPILHKEREISCRVTHVVNPSEFYIRSTTEGDRCPCTELDLKIRENNFKTTTDIPQDAMEPYFFGFACLEDAPEGWMGGPSPDIFVPPTLEEKLNSYMNTALNYKKLQVEDYMPKVELVAACVNHRWMRAAVLWIQQKDPRHLTTIRVQLLETGEKVTLGMKDVCRLPEQFCNTCAAAFRCYLYRASPVWLIWSKSAIAYFKELVENKDIRVIVKDGDGEATTKTFETTPYAVKIMVREENEGGNEKWIEVAQKMIDGGYGLEWNMLPYRPFAVGAIDTTSFDLGNRRAPQKPPPSTLELENKRFLWENELGTLNAVSCAVDDGSDLTEDEDGSADDENSSSSDSFDEVRRDWILGEPIETGPKIVASWIQHADKCLDSLSCRDSSDTCV